MEEELSDGDDSNFEFKRVDDIVDIERNLVYVRRRKKAVENHDTTWRSNKLKSIDMQ